MQLTIRFVTTIMMYGYGDGGEFMLKLIRALTQYKIGTEDGTLLAKAELKLNGEIYDVKSEVIPKRSNLLIMKAVGYDSSGNPSAELTLYAMKYVNTRSEKKIPPDNIRKYSDTISFSKDMINKYLTASGDTNPIHFGAKPIVPGLLMLSEILNQFPVSDVSVRFYHSVFADENIYVSAEDNKIVLFTENYKAAEIQIIKN